MKEALWVLCVVAFAVFALSFIALERRRKLYPNYHPPLRLHR